VINVNTGEKFSTIQEAIDDADTVDGHEILVTPNDYDEEAFVSKDLSFFVQSGSTGITLTLANQYDALTEYELNMKVLSEADITLKGNDGDNTITILRAEDLSAWSASSGSAADHGTITNLDGASYTVYGLGGNDVIGVDPDSLHSHSFYGGSGDDFISGGQARDWLDGGSGNDIIISHGGDDRILAGSGDDDVVLATRDDTNGGDGRTLILLGGGKDEVIMAALDNAQGIDIEAYIGDFARGQDRINTEAMADGAGATLDLADLLGGSMAGSTITLDAYSAEYLDSDGDAQVVSAEGSVHLLGINTSRLSATDFKYAGDMSWHDEYEAVFGLAQSA
jgi:Ca2+-binding RTX toxin-like protein